MVDQSACRCGCIEGSAVYGWSCALKELDVCEQTDVTRTKYYALGLYVTLCYIIAYYVMLG